MRTPGLKLGTSYSKTGLTSRPGHPPLLPSEGICMPKLITIESFDSFSKIKDIMAREITPDIMETVRNLDEKTEIEVYIRSSIFDINRTPHGPVELVDIFTHKCTVKGLSALVAFIIKGKSFKTVRARDVAHQIYRLKKISGLNVAVLAYTGNLLDPPREQFVATAREIGCDYAFFDAIDLARLFVSEGFICPRDGRIISQYSCTCGYSPKRKELNILQRETLKELSLSHKLNEKSGLIVLPTGVGKTRVAAKDSHDFQAKSVLYVAHTHEILDIAEEEFANIFGKGRVNRAELKGDLKRKSQVTLSTIQLISRNLKVIKAIAADYLIIDEFHHAAARTYRALIEMSKPKYLLGLTATPFRGDRQDVAELCDGNVLINAELRTAIESGILSPYHYIGCFDDINYSNIRHNGIRYDIRDLEKSLILPRRDKAIIKKWCEYLQNKPTLAFCCSKKHAIRCCNAFREEGITSEVLVSDTDYEERKRIKNQFQKGNKKVIFSVDVLNEGVDFPFVEGLLFLRPTESKRIFFQQLGRGLRRFTGKRETIVLDFIGNFKNAYKIVEYVGLTPYENELGTFPVGKTRNAKEILNLPLGCEVTFDDKVIDIFCSQHLAEERITRYNIGRILVYNYKRLCMQLNKMASRADVDRNLLLHSGFYSMVFGSWGTFLSIMSRDQVLLRSIQTNSGS